MNNEIEKNKLLKDLLANPHFLIMMVSLYYEFNYDELKKYKDILEWGAEFEIIHKIGIDGVQERFDYEYALGLLFNPNIKWSKQKLNLRFKLDLEDYLTTISNLPYLLYDIINAKYIYAQNELNSKISVEMTNADYLLERTKLFNEVDVTRKAYYPFVDEIGNVEELLRQFEKHNISYDYGLLINPQIWYRYYRQKLSEADIHKLLDEIKFRKRRNKLLGIDDSVSLDGLP